MNETIWGYHLILNLVACDKAVVTSAEHLAAWVSDLVSEIEMTAYGEPIIEHFAAHNPEVAGFTLVQLIETSAITGHLVDRDGNAYIDIFSCREFDPDVALNVTRSHLHPSGWDMQFLIRGPGRIEQRGPQRRADQD